MQACTVNRGYRNGRCANREKETRVQHRATGEPGSVVSITLPATAVAARDARRYVEKQLVGVDDEVRDNAILLVSELVSNALRHAGTAIDVEVRRGRRDVRVEVTDGHERYRLRPGSADPEAEDGRGLLLVDRIATDWGVERRGKRKAVWFTLALA